MKKVDSIMLRRLVITKQGAVTRIEYFKGNPERSHIPTIMKTFSETDVEDFGPVQTIDRQTGAVLVTAYRRGD